MVFAIPSSRGTKKLAGGGCAAVAEEARRLQKKAAVEGISSTARPAF
jgi:hypothetical protein